jgi:hypothetical protein
MTLKIWLLLYCTGKAILIFFSFAFIKWKTKTYHTVKTVPNSNRKKS